MNFYSQKHEASREIKKEERKIESDKKRAKKYT
jgi:hypothetical protein